MIRRDVIALLGGAAAAWPLAARAQQPAKLPTIGFIGSDSPGQYTDRLRAFRLGLKSTGFTEGQNVEIEYRWAEGRNDRLPELTADLVRRQVAVIVAPTTPSVLVAKAATKTIPIVFFTAGDPVDLGLVASLSRSNNNLTGATTLTLEVGPKWLQLLHEMVPNATSLALLINPTSASLAEAQSRDLEAAARSRGLSLHVLQASTDQDFDTAFANVARLGASGLVISSDSFFFSQSAQLARLAIRHAVPTIFGFREFVAAGGLMSYGGRSVAKCHVHTDVEEGIEIATDRAISAALIVNELIANAAKYAYQGRSAGNVWVKVYRTSGDGFAISVRDEGAGLPTDFDPRQDKGLGMKIVTSFTQQLNAHLAVRACDPGTEFVLLMRTSP